MCSQPLHRKCANESLEIVPESQEEWLAARKVYTRVEEWPVRTSHLCECRFAVNGTEGVHLARFLGRRYTTSVVATAQTCHKACTMYLERGEAWQTRSPLFERGGQGGCSGLWLPRAFSLRQLEAFNNLKHCSSSLRPARCYNTSTLYRVPNNPGSTGSTGTMVSYSSTANSVALQLH